MKMRNEPTLPKLVASDIGGTLMYDSNGIPGFTAQVLNRLVEKGIPVVLITGYNINAAQRYTGNLDDRIMLMPQNGSICLRGEEIICEYLIPPERVKELADFLTREDLPVIIYKGKQGDFANFYVYKNELPLSYPFTRIDHIENYNNITGISTLLPDDQAQKVRTELQAIAGEQFKIIYSRLSKGSWLEVVHAEVRKDLSLRRLCVQLGISLADVMYFGDNLNDKEVLQAVGYPVLVENALPELKVGLPAAEVIAPVDKEGAAHYLNELYGLGLKP